MLENLENIKEEDLVEIDGGSYTGPCFIYTIKSGDTLSQIAKRYNTTIAILMEINPAITDANKIYANTTIYVPYITYN